jgi:hypothetical protein
MPVFSKLLLPKGWKFSRNGVIKSKLSITDKQQERIDARVAAARERVAAKKKEDAEAVERLLQEQADLAFLELDGKFSDQIETIRLYLNFVSISGSADSKITLVSELEKLKGILTSMKAMPNASQFILESNEKIFNELCDKGTSLL